jgi:hypothetical protein
LRHLDRHARGVAAFLALPRERLFEVDRKSVV